MRGIISRDFQDEDCNCHKIHKTLVDGKLQCIYKGNCGKKTLVYKAQCKHCDQFYIGNTSQNLKKKEHNNTCSIQSED